MRHYGGPIFVLRELKTTRRKSEHGSKLDFYLILMFKIATHNFITLLKVI